MERKDRKLYFSLIAYALLPSIYLLVRMHIIAINNVDINIMGQMEWFDLIDEVLTILLIEPLYYVLKEKSFKNKNGAAFLVAFPIYTLFTVLVAVNISKITEYMQAEYAAQYLGMQAIAMIANFATTFIVLVFTMETDNVSVWKIIIARLVVQICMDWLLIDRFADIGAAYSEIISNIVVSVTAFAVAYKRGYLYFSLPEKNILKEWARIGRWSGLRIFLDNYIYAIIVCRMVNAVSQAGNYWVANNFLWGWVLVPITCLVNIIQKNDLARLSKDTCWKPLAVIMGIWLITLPGWQGFIGGPMAGEETTIMPIVLSLLPFYVFYAVSAVIDGWFVCKGKTIYTAINSIIVNIGYYGIVYWFFRKGFFVANMQFIIYMFGFGMIVHAIVSIIMYRMVQHKMVYFS